MSQTAATPISEADSRDAGATFGGEREERYLLLRIAFWLAGVAFALQQTWCFHNFINADTVSYFDMSDGIAGGDWSRLVNGTWSPLYPALLGVMNTVVKPTPYWQFTAAHFLSLLLFLIAFAGFEFLLSSLLRQREPAHDSDYLPLPDWLCRTLGYTVLLWTSLGLIGLKKLNPDLLMAGLLFVGMGLLVRIKRGQNHPAMYAGLGAVVALGYLAKAPMFPIGLLMLGSTLFFGLGLRKSAPRFLLALAVFTLLASPYIIALSKLKHRLTFGESGRFNLLFHVNNAGPAPYWETLGTGAGKLLHPPRKIFNNPPAYEFALPGAITQPLWFDPSYWVEGGHPVFYVRSQYVALRKALDIYVDLFSRSAGLMVAFAGLCFLLGAQRSRQGLLRLWPLWSITIFALGMFMLVHLEERYVGAFVAVLWLGLFFALEIPAQIPNRLLLGMVVGILLSLMVPIVNQASHDIADAMRASGNKEYEAAVALGKLDIQRHDAVARISPFVADGWARLAGVRIVAEVQTKAADDFWSATPAVQQAVLQAFSKAGAKAVVAPVRTELAPPGWQLLGNSGYAVELLRSPQ